MNHHSNGKKSRVRWVILFMMCLMYLITYIDRTAISIVAPSIRQEFGFNQVQIGFIFSAFAWAHAIGQIPGGWMGDRFGPRSVLATIVTYWSLMTIVTIQAVSYLSFFAIRFLFGLGEAGAFPTATRAMQLWFRKSERGFVQGITHSFSRFGAAIVPPIAVAIMAAWGWHSVFYVFGILGLVWSLLYFIVYRNLPEQHKWVNQAELAHIRGFDESGNMNKSADIKKKPNISWKALLSSPNMWCIMGVHFCYSYCLWFYLSWLPIYLVDYRHFSWAQMGLLASLPLLSGVVGDTVGGIATDKVLEKTNNIKVARKVVAVTGMLGAAIFTIPAALTTDPYMAVYCLTASMFFLECVVGPAWAVPMDVGGEHSGTVSGVMNASGSIGAAVSPIIFGGIISAGYWTAPFFVQVILLIIGAFVWFFLLNPAKSVTIEALDSSPTIGRNNRITHIR